MKRKIFYLIVIIILLPFIFYSCDDSSTQPILNSGVLIPLKIGNEWDYKIIETVTVNPDSFSIDTLKQRIINEENINNEIWYFRSVDSNSAFIRLINREKGLYLSIFEEEMQIVKYPLILGDSVIFTTFHRTNENDEVIDTFYTYKKITSINKTISVPAGKFNCVELTDINYSKSDILIYPESHKEYYAINVGLIKMVDYYEDYTGNLRLQRSMELIDFDLK